MIAIDLDLSARAMAVYSLRDIFSIISMQQRVCHRPRREKHLLLF